MNYDTKAGCARIQRLVDEEIARLSRHIYSTSEFLEKMALISSKSYVEDHRELLGSTPIMKSNRESEKSAEAVISLDVSEKNIIYSNSQDVADGTKVENLEEISIITLKRNDSPKLIPVYSFESNGNEDDERIEKMTSDQSVTSVESSGFVEGNISSFVTNDGYEVGLYCSQNENCPTVTTQPDCKNSNDNLKEVRCYSPLPSLSDEFLDSLALGSLEESDRHELSKEEIEEKFLRLVLVWTANRKNMEERYQNQFTLCQKYKEDLRKQISQTIFTLMQRNDCGETSTNDVVKHLDLIKQSLDDMFCIAFEYGALQYRIRTNEYWNLIINYAALLKQELDDNKSSIPPTTKIHSQDENENSKTDSELLKRRKYSKPKQMQVTVISGDYTPLDEVNCVTSWNKLKNIFSIMILLTIIFLGFTLYVQLQCSRSALKAPLCPLDYIFKYRRFRFGILPM